MADYTYRTRGAWERNPALLRRYAEDILKDPGDDNTRRNPALLAARNAWHACLLLARAEQLERKEGGKPDPNPVGSAVLGRAERCKAAPDVMDPAHQALERSGGMYKRIDYRNAEMAERVFAVQFGGYGKLIDLAALREFADRRLDFAAYNFHKPGAEPAVALAEWLHCEGLARARAIEQDPALAKAREKAPLNAPPGRFVLLHGGEEVHDTVTRLIWRRCAQRMGLEGDRCVERAAANTVAPARETAWRAPTQDELMSLVLRPDASDDSPVVDPLAFPDMPRMRFEAAGIAGRGDIMPYVDFGRGVRGGSRPLSTFRQRLVRDAP